MGLVKFGQTTLNVAEIPDGHIVISDAQFQSLKGAENNYLSLKASIPYGVDMSQLPVIIEKGSRFDSTANELNTVKQQLGAATTRLQGFSNLPQDFSLDEYKALKADQANKDKTSMAILKPIANTRENLSLDRAMTTMPQ